MGFSRAIGTTQSLWIFSFSSAQDPVTRGKVVFVSPKSALLTADIPQGILPPELGGTGAWRPIEDAWALLLKGEIEPFKLTVG